MDRARSLLAALPLALAALAFAVCGSDAATSETDAATSDATCSTCFRAGRWQLDNLSPCFVFDEAQRLVGATSSEVGGGVASCPSGGVATAAWSTSALTTDCPGHYRLCLALKAGDASAPDAADCGFAAVCADGVAPTAGAPAAWPPLPAWNARAEDLPCVQRFIDAGGYAELSVSGAADACGRVAQVLTRVRYCPLACNAHPDAAGCADCFDANAGSF